MNKVCGNISDFSISREDESRYIISYGLEEASNGLYTWYEIYFYKKQKFLISFDDVKDAILADIDSQTDKAILTGYTWNEMQVWLSTENQFNYKAAFDLAVQTNGQNLPVKFKFGTPDEPVYYTFTELSELQNFYVGAVTFINQTLDTGWQRKDSIDWEPYKEYFPESEEPVTK